MIGKVCFKEMGNLDLRRGSKEIPVCRNHISIVVQYFALCSWEFATLCNFLQKTGGDGREIIIVRLFSDITGPCSKIVPRWANGIRKR